MEKTKARGRLEVWGVCIFLITEQEIWLVLFMIVVVVSSCECEFNIIPFMPPFR